MSDMIKGKTSKLQRQEKTWAESSIIKIKMVEQKKENKCGHLATQSS